jgi:two-component system, cell cycle sensor histidine kinase and response regulator CckA
MSKSWGGTVNQSKLDMTPALQVRTHPLQGSLRILYLEDNPYDLELCTLEMRKAGFQPLIDGATTREEFLDKLHSSTYDIVLSDHGIPGWNGVEAFREVKHSGIDIPFILITGTLGEERAVELIKEGVTDYILKDRLARLPSAVRKALEARAAGEERRQALEALRASEEQVRLLLDSTAEGIYAVDQHGTCTLANRACSLLLGYDGPADLFGKNMHALIHHTRPEGTPYPARECRAYVAFRNGEGAHVDDEILWRKDGSSFPAEYWSYPMRRDGDSIGLVMTFLDITQRKKAEEDLRMAAAIVEATEDAVIGMSLDGTILTWNPSAERIYGYSAVEVIGRPIGIVIPPERQHLPIEIRDKVKRGEKVMPFESVALRKDGKRIQISLSFSPLKDKKGNIVGFSSIIRDITQAKQMTEMFRQAQKMEAVGRLAGGVAHDFNNLLGVIVGYGEMFLGRSDFDPEMRKHLEEMVKAAERGASLTRQLLAYSRQQMLEPTVLNLNTVITDMLKMIHRLIGEDVEVRTSLSPSLANVEADRGQIEQVIMNLAVNSRDAMPTGGTLTFETSNVDLDEDYAQVHPPVVGGQYVLLSITDTGVGMDSETKARAFEPFFTTKERDKGTGLGLSTVYGIVKQSRGYIWMYSEVGQGTVFKIYLPRAADPVVMTPPAPATIGSLQGTETILLVEDKEDIRVLIRLILEQNGYTVIDAPGGVRALEIARQHPNPIDLLLSDVVMPEMNGRVLAQQATAIRPQLRVLYMSGYTGTFLTRDERYDAEAILLQKPFSRTTLLRKVREALAFRKESAPPHRS